MAVLKPGYLDDSDILFTYLLNGGSNDMGVNGSVTPVDFNYTPPLGKQALIGRLILYMESATAFDSAMFANLSPLDNGIEIYVNDQLISTWVDNIDIVTTFYDAFGYDAFAKATRSIAGRWSFSRIHGLAEGILLNSTNGMTARINDDLSAAGFILRMQIQGKLENDS